jgi:hypothetical protein
MRVHHDTARYAGMDSVTVWCNVPGATVCLVQDNKIISTGIVSGNKCLLSFSPVYSFDSVFVTVTALNQVTYQGYIHILPLLKGYVAAISHTLTDSLGVISVNANNKKTVYTTLQLQNLGLAKDSGIHISIRSSDRYISNLKMVNNYVHAISSLSIQNVKLCYKYKVADSVPDGHVVYLTCIITDSARDTVTRTFMDTLYAPVIQIIAHEVYDTSGHNKWWLNPGQNGVIRYRVVNAGHADCSINIPYTNSSNSLVQINTDTVHQIVIPGDSVWLYAPVSVSNKISINSYINFSAVIADSPYVIPIKTRYVIGRLVDRFETNNFNLFKWVLSGDSNWYVTDAQPYEGRYSAHSGHIADDQSTHLSITIICAQDDTLFFAYRVSSELNADSLIYMQDTNMLMHGSGEIGWTRAGFPISKGAHTLTWTYAKDPYLSLGQDCGWIDDVIFPGLATVPSADLYINKRTLQVKIFPNPSNALLDIQLQDMAASPSYTGALYGMDGSRIGTWPLVLGDNRVDVSRFPSGVYLFKCTNGRSTHIERIEIVH